MTITSLRPLLPHPVRVVGEPTGVDVDATGLRLAAGRQTDWFVNPARIARIGEAIAFHHSLDGERWAFVRHFRLSAEEELDVGFEAQSPLGSGCAATFTASSSNLRR